MTEEAAAWIRQHVWTDGMRRVEYEVRPGFYTRCGCQRDVCHQCRCGVHERCNAIPRQSHEGMIADKTGTHPACFKEPYKHVTVDGAPRPTVVAQVWLADRICRWACRCDCAGTLPMSPINAGWIRRNAWSKSFAERHARQYGDLYDRCPCQEDTDCPDQRSHSLPDGWLNGGIIFDQRCQLLSPIAVWLADRACRRLPKRVPPVAVPGGQQDALPGFDILRGTR
ncbi:DUF6248 family natural product biosynthesis protein [Streptosporangium sp. CA-135522]|uniref:DUF6248 family natural product biosynthesis protein n=1 Tax=Streptosporangium sp. CA-135522 TaxID=3240072 RepID=UPI003D8D074F